MSCPCYLNLIALEMTSMYFLLERDEALTPVSLTCSPPVSQLRFTTTFGNICTSFALSWLCKLIHGPQWWYIINTFFFPVNGFMEFYSVFLSLFFFFLAPSFLK